MARQGRKKMVGVRALAPWYAAEFCHSYAITLYSICVFYYAREQLDATPSERLWLMSGWGFLYIFFALLSGYLTDKWGPRTLALRMSFAGVATALLGLLVIDVPIMHSMWGLFGVMAVYNFTLNQMWPPLESGITRTPAVVPVSTRMSFYNLTWGTSNFLALFTATFIYSINWRLIFIVPAAISLIGGIGLWLFGIPQDQLKSDHGVHEATPASPTLELRNRQLLRMARVANTVSYVGINVLIAVLPTLMHIANVGEGFEKSVLNSTWAGARLIAFLVLWLWAGWHYSTRWMVGSFAALVASFVVMMVLPANVPALLVAELVFGFTIAMMYASSLYYSMHVSEGAGGHAGLHEALVGLGITLGPAAGALAGTGDEMGHMAPGIIWTVSGVMVIGLGALVVMARRVIVKPTAAT